MNKKFSHTRNQTFVQILSEFEVSPKHTLQAHLCPLAFCRCLNQGQKSPTNPRKLVVGTLSSHHAVRPGEKLHVEMEKHRRPVASLEMSCSHPFPEPGRGARPYMDTAGGALSPENVGYRVKAKTHGRACPRNTTAPRNRLLRGTAPSGRRSGLGGGGGRRGERAVPGGGVGPELSP